MPIIDSTTLAALQARAVQARDFLYLTGKSLDDGSPVSFGFWTGLDTITATVVDGDSGADAVLTYAGGDVALEIDDIPLVSGISIRTIAVKLSQVSDAVAAAVMGADLKGAAAQVHRGIFNISTNTLVAKPLCRFIGTVDKCVVNTPQEGEAGSVQLTLASHTRELTRINTDVCSDESQQLRHSGDRFYKDMAVVGKWNIFWGQKNDALNAQRKVVGVSVPAEIVA
ncbi:MAG: hypothetical protein JO256_08185 [Alphaproteobacteria bacterium]|nr:hypothetical protein [Alphaproteobacteria bacterium]